MGERQKVTAVGLLDGSGDVAAARHEFEPGGETGWHRHARDYVIVAITDCHMRLEEPKGEFRDVDVPSGEAYHRAAGVEHNVINRGEDRMVFVEVEFGSSQAK